jgi:hypothetical protein
VHRGDRSYTPCDILGLFNWRWRFVWHRRNRCCAAKIFSGCGLAVRWGHSCPVSQPAVFSTHNRRRQRPRAFYDLSRDRNGFCLRLPTATPVFASPVFAAAIEVVQNWVPGRHARMGDFVVDVVAACWGIGLSRVLMQLRWGRVGEVSRSTVRE